MHKKRGRPIIRRLILILIIGLAAALQYSAARYMNVAGVFPNLMFVAAVAAGYAISSEAGGFAGLCLGLYQDAQSGKIMGMHALFFLYGGVIAGLFPKKSSIGDLPMMLIAMYALTVLYEGGLYIFAYAIPATRGGFGPGLDALNAVATVIIPAAFLNVICCVPFYFVLGIGGSN